MGSSRSKMKTNICRSAIKVKEERYTGRQRDKYDFCVKPAGRFGI